MKQNKAREEIVKLFVDCLYKEDIPWHRGFMPSRTSYNPVTKTVYKNSNRFILYLNEYLHHYDDPRWMTFKQALEAGYHIRKGEKGVPIEYWSIYDKKEKKKLSFQEVQELLEKHPERKDDIRYISRVYYVFNARQMDGIEPYKEKMVKDRDEIDEHFSLPYQLLHRFGDVTHLDIHEDMKVNTPYYSLDKDKVVIPDHHRYKLSDAFFSDAFHVVSHATAHATRLNREITNFKIDPEKYAIEELRAEIGSSFVCNDLGIVPHPNDDYLKNSQAYIQSWLKVIEEKPNTLFAAIKDAEKICDYILDKGEYQRLKEIQIIANEAIDNENYQPDRIDEKDLRLLLGKEYVEVTSSQLTSFVDDWSNGKKVDNQIYYAFDQDKVICADNTTGDMFVEEFNKEDYMLAYLWMEQGMSIDEVMSLKFQETKEIDIVK